MSRRRRRDWVRLDNAAKIFPSTASGRSNNVFRISCELMHDVDAVTLQHALDITIGRFPIFQVVLKRGFFWYYLERTDLMPQVQQEHRPPCSRIYNKDIRSLLFEVTYYKKRINLEVFHALADGTGAMQFLRTLLVIYLSMKHSGSASDDIPDIDYDASYAQKSEDSFDRYYDPTKKYKSKKVKSYLLKGPKVPEGRLNIIEGVMSAREALKLSKAAGVTLTEYFTALLILSVRNEIPIRFAHRPVVIAIPVNLRKYFESFSARNFFGLITVGQSMDSGVTKVEDIAKQVKESFAAQLTPGNLIRRMSGLTSLERNLLLRAVPLVLKDITLKIGKDRSQSDETCTFSNVGIVDMPEFVRHYIDRFEVFNSTNKLQACLCTYGDKLTITFTSAFSSTEVQKNFFRGLTSAGVETLIVSNDIS